MAAARVHQATPPMWTSSANQLAFPWRGRDRAMEEPGDRQERAGLFTLLFFSFLLLSFSSLQFSSFLLYSLHFTSIFFFSPPPLFSSPFFSVLFHSLFLSPLFSSHLFSSLLFSLFLFPLVPNLQLLSDISLPDKGAIQWLRRTAPNSWGSKGNILQYKKP